MAKILLFDIETCPSRGYFFDLFKEGNILWTDKEWHLLSFAYKWLEDSTAHVRALPDYPLYQKDPESDKALITELWGLFNDADIIIGHNGDRFDIRKTNARFIRHGLKPPPPRKTVDTLKVAKRYFKFDSNRLDALGQYLGVGRKERTGGIDLWKDCMEGDMKAWRIMKRYNKQDVILLEQVYFKLRPWMGNHPNLNIINAEDDRCPVCESQNTYKRGKTRVRTGWKPRLQCKDCGAWHSGELVKYEV